MIVVNRWTLVGLFSLIHFIVFGQEYYANVRNIGVAEGLSHYKVLSLYPDSSGMWIGTVDGLNFFDGYTWKNWKKEENQLTNKIVNFIHKDQDQALWLFEPYNKNKRSSIISIDILPAGQDSTLTLKQYLGTPLPFQIKNIQHFFEDQKNRLFFIVDQKVWQYTSANHFEVLSLPSGFKPSTALGDGVLAGNLNNRFALVTTNGELLFQTADTLRDFSYSILGDLDQFWLHPYGKSCKVFKRTVANTYQYTSTQAAFQKEKYPYLSLLLFDQERQQLWINHGAFIHLYDKNHNLLYRHKAQPRKICLDHQRNLWIGKYEVKILQLQKKKFKKYLYQNKGQFSINNSIHCRGILIQDNRLFINTYEDLKIIDLTTGALLPSPKNLKLNFAILQDHEDNIWMARKKLYQLNASGTKIEQEHTGNTKNLRIWSLFEDQTHRIWLGHVGLSFFEAGKIQAFQDYNGFTDLADALILFFYKDKNGVIWLGSDRGLFQLDLQKGITAQYGKNLGDGFELPSNKFQHMYQDSEGIFWLATEDVGLIRWDKASGTIQCFDKKYGLPANNLYAVYEDDFKQLWISSFNGIIRFNRQTKEVHVYDEENGISGNEYNRISHHQAEDGTIYFGGQNGLTAFHPKDFYDHKPEIEKFALRIKHTSIFGKKSFVDTLDNGEPIDLQKLGSGIRVVDIELASSDIFWTDKVDIYYTLQKTDEAQNSISTSKPYISSDNHIELFGLTPGHYNLQIKALKKNGKQLGETMNIPLNIAQPFFYNPLFWVALLLLSGSIIWLYIKFRTARLRRRKEELEVMVTERTQQILKDQQIIQTQAEQIQTMKDQLSRKDELWLDQFKTIVNQRLSDSEFYLPDVINDLEISRSLFYEKVKTLTQMTPNQYIQELRLTKAKAILDAGDVRTVKEVAYAVGMNRPSYFSKLFKERFGILPSAYFRNTNHN